MTYDAYDTNPVPNSPPAALYYPMAQMAADDLKAAMEASRCRWCGSTAVCEHKRAAPVLVRTHDEAPNLCPTCGAYWDCGCPRPVREAERRDIAHQLATAAIAHARGCLPTETYQQEVAYVAERMTIRDAEFGMTVRERIDQETMWLYGGAVC